MCEGFGCELSERLHVSLDQSVPMCVSVSLNMSVCVPGEPCVSMSPSVSEMRWDAGEECAWRGRDSPLRLLALPRSLHVTLHRHSPARASVS